MLARGQQNEDVFKQDEEYSNELMRRDLEAAGDAEYAFQLQLSMALSISSSKEFKESELTIDGPESDYLLALRMNANAHNGELNALWLDELEAKNQIELDDRIFVTSLHHGNTSELKRRQLDRDFASKIQKLDEDGYDIDDYSNKIVDPDKMAEYNKLVIPVEPEGKGKAKAKVQQPPPVLDRAPQCLAQCSVCFEPVQVVSNPFKCSKAANTSNTIIYGIDLHRISHAGDPRLSGTNAHVACIGCLTTYITACKIPITEVVAQNVLGDKMEEWHYQQLLMNTPHIFCPAKRCSGRVVLNDDGNPQAECPECNKLICGSCKTIWHAGNTCKQYQALPDEEKDLEDTEALNLAKEKGWKRCYSCKNMVSLAFGCNHITCVCSAEFCYKCGSEWINDKCSSPTTCALWDEANLIEARRNQAQIPVNPPRNAAVEAARNVEQQRLARLAQQQQHQAAAMRAAAEREQIARGLRERQMMEEEDDYDGNAYNGYAAANHFQERELALNALGGVGNYPGAAHRFTNTFTQMNICSYCNPNVQYPNFNALIHHLAETQDHNVFSCCGKLFQRQEHLSQHVDFATRDGSLHQAFAK